MNTRLDASPAIAEAVHATAPVIFKPLWRTLRLVLLALLSVLLNGVAPAAAQTRIIRAARVWDGAQIQNDVSIVIDRDRISRILPGSAELPPGAEVIDLRKYRSCRASSTCTPT